MLQTAQDPVLMDCAICGETVDIFDKLNVDKETVHKNCFKCCYCDKNLRVGSCAMALAFYNRIGPRWYCAETKASCAMLPNDAKEAKLKEKGLDKRKSKLSQAE